MTRLNWEKAKSKYADKSNDFRMPKKTKPKRRNTNKCFMSKCKAKRYRNSNKFLQSYCLTHCIQFGKKL